MSHRRLSQASDHPPFKSPDAAVRERAQEAEEELEGGRERGFVLQRAAAAHRHRKHLSDGGREGRGRGHQQGQLLLTAANHSSRFEW